MGRWCPDALRARAMPLACDAQATGAALGRSIGQPRRAHPRSSADETVDVFHAPDVHTPLAQRQALCGLGLALLRKQAPQDREGHPCMPNGQAQEIARETPTHPMGAIHGEGGGFLRQKRDNTCRHPAWCALPVLQKSLKT